MTMSDAVKAQQVTKEFAVVFPPQVPGDRIARATIFLNGENRRDVEVYVYYSDDKNDLSSSNVPKGRASCKTISSGQLSGNLNCTFIFPHLDHPEPNILTRQEIGGGEPPETRPTRHIRGNFVRTDKNPKRIGAPNTVFYQWVKVVKRGNSAPSTFSDEIRDFKMPRFLTIANIGDSYAAGEGAPNRELVRTVESAYGTFDNGKSNQFSDVAMWDDFPCHRSGKSGQMQAIKQLIEKHPDVAVRSMNVSCAGAKIGDGLIGAQEIPEDSTFFDTMQPLSKRRGPTPTTRESQIAAVRKLLERADREVLDIMILSIGGNDANFGTAGTACLLNILDCKDDTQLKADIREGVAALPSSFANLKAAIDLNLVVNQVFLVEYPDPTRDGEGLFCDNDSSGSCWGLLEKTIEQRDFQFIHDELLVPLNQALESAARIHSWTYVGGTMAKSKNQGLCSCRSAYFNTVGMSDDTQGDFFGSIHPTVKGYREIYQPIVYRVLESYVSQKRQATAVEVAKEAAREAARLAALRRRSEAERAETIRKILELPVFKTKRTIQERIQNRIQKTPAKVRPVEVENDD